MVNKKKSKILDICLFFPSLFICELILGYSGKIFMVCNIPIRNLLFVLSFISIYFLVFYYSYKNNIKIFNIKDRKSFLGSFEFLDVAFVLLFLSMIFFSTIVSHFFGNGIKLALNEVASPMLIMSLFFPINYFIKVKLINFKRFEKYIYYLILLFSIIHIFLYIGQSINNKFIESYFYFLKSIFFNTSILPKITLGHLGSPRVFFPNSIWLIVGIYIFFKNFKNVRWYDYVIFAINITAILTTMTKSIWLGLEIGTFLYSICYIIKQIKSKNKNNIFKIIIFFIGTFTFIFIANLFMFNNTLSDHFLTTFSNSEYYSKSNNFSNDSVNDKSDNYKKDREGSIISNDIKIKQIKVLLDKWKKSPIIGFGYGSYEESFIRSEECPYSYEMTFFSLLMKTGLVGILFWIILILALIRTKIKNTNISSEDFFSWMFLVISFGILVQTNPLMFNSVGIALLLFIAFESTNYSKE